MKRQKIVMSITIAPDLRAELKAQAARERSSMSAILNRLVEQYLRQRRGGRRRER